MPERTQGDHPALPDRLKHWEENLWPVQVEALATLATQPPPLGIYGDVPVGGGKFLIATLAGAVLQAKRPLVMTQPDLLAQAQSEFDRFESTFPELREHPPQYLAYSTLSQPKNSDILHRLAPDVIALDEAHAVAARSSARGLRLREYVQSYPDTRVVILSGTLNRKSLLDIYDLAELALRDQMWLPVSDQIQNVWASLLDHGAKPGDKMLRQYLTPLLKWAEKRGLEIPTPVEQDAYQAAYRRRYISTPGVVAPAETKVDAELHVTIWRPPAPDIIRENLKTLDKTWCLPDGTELVDALEYYRHASSISAGFYYKPVFEGEEDVFDLWQERRLEWNRALRLQIKYIAKTGIDSPANVERACLSGRAHPDVRRAYVNWVEVRDLIQLDSETVWLDRSLIELAAENARSLGRCLVWYESRAVGEAFKDLGFRVYGAGSKAPTPDVDLPVLSRRVHGTGKNLQSWDTQIVVEPPSSATPWEQMLGRTHRPGQLSDLVQAYVLCATWAPRGRVYSAMAEADFVARTSNKKHKLTFCTWHTCKQSRVR